jgi:hypothetical protein
MGENGLPYHSTYVHFNYWFENQVARNFYDRVIHPEKEARIVYDDPWYWVVLKNKGKNHVVNGRKPRIDLTTSPGPLVPPPPPHVDYVQLEEIEKAIQSIRKQILEYDTFDFYVNKRAQQLFANLYAQEAYYLAYYQFYRELYEDEDEDLEEYEDYIDENMSIS